MNVGLIIPTRNAGSLWKEVVEAVSLQTFPLTKKIIIDSESEDDTCDIAKRYNFEIHKIKRTEFDHGGTRNMALEVLSFCDIVIFLTQDVILKNTGSIQNLVKCFQDENIACVYGRQLPHADATPIAQYERKINYPETSRSQNIKSMPYLGFDTCFCSDAFSAFRVEDVKRVGGFPDRIIFGEDSFLAAKLVLSGKKVEYNPLAMAYHSHNYSFKQHLKRYFDIGVFLKDQSWLIENFGRPQSKGLKVALNGFMFLFPQNIKWMPSYIFITLIKYVGYKLGFNYKYLPTNLIMALTMNKSFWLRK